MKFIFSSFQKLHFPFSIYEDQKGIVFVVQSKNEILWNYIKIWA